MELDTFKVHSKLNLSMILWISTFVVVVPEKKGNYIYFPVCKATFKKKEIFPVFFSIKYCNIDNNVPVLNYLKVVYWMLLKLSISWDSLVNSLVTPDSW